jgi:tetratricopeptide (TPR) repeat protein
MLRKFADTIYCAVPERAVYSALRPILISWLGRAHRYALVLEPLLKTAGCLILTILVGALPLTASAVVPANIEMTIAAARQAAHSDRNAESARLFEQAVAEDPGRRLELLPELSDQLTYSGKSSEAIPLYREALAAHTLQPEGERHVRLGLALALSWSHYLAQSLKVYGSVLARNPRDIEALLGSARVLSWEDQLRPSIREYKLVLAIDPNNLEARENIARVTSWRGRQREAQHLARAILADHPGDLSASLTLADSELWMGRPDRAAVDEQLLVGTHPGDSGVRDLAGDLIDQRQPQLNIASSVATSSDGLLIRSSTFQTAAQAGQGTSTFGFQYEPISYIGQPSVGDAMERNVGVFARTRLSDSAEINATVANDEITATGNPNAKNVLLYNAYLTLWPNDSLRFDIGSRSQTYDNVISLQKGITSDVQTFSMDFTPDEDTRFTVRAFDGAFTDGNREGWEQLEFDRAVLRTPHLSFGAQATSYSFAETLYNGYFDPPRYQSAVATTHIYGNSRRRLYYDASGAYGREWVVDGGARPTFAVHGQLSYVLSRAISLSGFYDSFNTRQYDSGFARTTIGLSLQSKF